MKGKAGAFGQRRQTMRGQFAAQLAGRDQRRVFGDPETFE
jgi:hypothetical protein